MKVELKMKIKIPYADFGIFLEIIFLARYERPTVEKYFPKERFIYDFKP